MTVEALREMLMKSHVSTLKLIGVDFNPDDSIAEVHTKYAVCVVDFMDFCGIRGSLTTNWHKILHSQIGPKYDDVLISVTNLTTWWASQHKCTGVDHFVGKFASTIDGRTKVIDLEYALLMGCEVGSTSSREKFAQM